MTHRAELESVYPYVSHTGEVPPCTYNEKSTTSVAIDYFYYVKESDVG